MRCHTKFWKTTTQTLNPNTINQGLNKILKGKNSKEFKVRATVWLAWRMICVGAESDQQVNICSFAVRCDRRWPSTQWHRVYTSSGNVPYVQFESVGDFITEPRCSKFAVGLQTRRRKMEGTRGPVGLWSEEPRVTGAPLCAKCLSMCSRLEPSGSAVVC